MQELMNFFFGNLVNTVPDYLLIILQACLALVIMVSLGDIISIFVRWLFNAR